jgi:hypothetical protein
MVTWTDTTEGATVSNISSRRGPASSVGSVTGSDGGWLVTVVVVGRVLGLVVTLVVELDLGWLLSVAGSVSPDPRPGQDRGISIAASRNTAMRIINPLLSFLMQSLPSCQAFM